LIVATSRKEIQERFHRAALDAYAAHGFQSYRHAEQVTGVNYSTIYVIVSIGRLPSRGQVIEWLDLGGYDPIPADLIDNATANLAIELGLRNAHAIPEEGKNEIRDFVRDIRKRYSREGEGQT
jgi:hypothetical protein